MIFKTFKTKKLSMLGFGTMRLPMKDGRIDEEEVVKMIDYAMDNGVNYFDTAYPYHEGMSEIIIGRALSKYQRDSYYLADKYPGHQISDTYDPAQIFEEQLKKCAVDYFDFYLLHNVYENSMDVYLDKRWGIIDYFKEQKRQGRIKHLGFSTHARQDTLEKFLDEAGGDMEFCQIQLNYLDYTLQDAAAKAELLRKRNIPIWVMEPLRGGKLSMPGTGAEEKLSFIRKNETPTAIAFRFLQSIPEVAVVLSGMSNFSQMKENINTFREFKPLNLKEREILFSVAEDMKNSVPCTACRYCTSGCPMGLDIPSLIATYNDLMVDAKTNPTMWIDGLTEDKKPSACIGCGACAHICPQSIDIPDVMQKLSEKLETIPKWSDICKARAQAAKKAKDCK